MFEFDREVDVEREDYTLLMDTLDSGIHMRHKAKRLEDQMEELKKKANSGLEWAFKALGIKKAKLEGFGSLSWIKKARTSYDMDKLGDVLLRAGVDAKIIKRAIKAGTSSKDSEYVEFRRARKK